MRSIKLYFLWFVFLGINLCSYAQTFQNGLTKTTQGNIVELGGANPLVKNTDIDLGASFYFNLKKTTSNYFTVLNGGNVGIGTINPTNKFHVNGSVRFEGLGSQISYTRILAVDNTGLLAYRDASTLGGGGSVTLNSTQIAFGNVSNQLSSSSDFTWNGTRLMLGNFTAAAITTPVSINTGATFGSNTPGAPGNLKLRLFDDNTNVYGLGISSGVMEYQVPTGANHRFYVAGAEVMRLANTGNVGIGTGSPAYKLDVNGSAHFGGNTPATSMLVTSNGDIGIGTVPVTNMAIHVSKNVNATVGIRFQNSNPGPESFTAVQLGDLIQSFGESRPVASNATAGGRQQNRNVEIVVFADSAASQ